MTSALGLWKDVKELQNMGADEVTIAAAKGLAGNAISRAGMLNSAKVSSGNN
jgi:hypothetical protein